MDNTALMAIAPLDGRYQAKITPLRQIFSEYGLIRFRVLVEIRWLEALLEWAKLPELTNLNPTAKKTLHLLAENFSLEDASHIKQTEATINHDVKAVEYFIKERMNAHAELTQLAEFIHFGCTSEDINNLAYGLMLKEARDTCILPALRDILTTLKKIAHTYAATAMLARTHGQPASPTTLGKEFANVIARLERQIHQLKNVEILGKMNGASGNYNAFAAAYPDVQWQNVSQQFVTHLGLTWNPYTTQIEPHDTLAEFFAVMMRINTILLDFDRDTWAYIAINYFKQKPVANEVGSSTMPHKVNPIDFENSEGNLGIANALFEHMIVKLPVSRWQRDLSDSTVLRNIGTAIGHSLLAYQSTLKGLSKLEPNLDVIAADLNAHWEVLAEPIQTLMRRYGLPQPYEQLKAFTRGKPITPAILKDFIGGLDLPVDVKARLLALTPADYIGYAKELAKQV